MTQTITRRWADEREAKCIENYPDPEAIPDDLVRRIAMEFTVKTICPECHHEAYFFSNNTTQTVECHAADCDEEFLLP